MAAKKKKSGNTMLRMEPALHGRVARTADALGMSMNSLLNLIVQSALSPFEDLAAVTMGLGTTSLFAQWQRLNQGRDVFEFYRDLDQLGWRNTGRWSGAFVPYVPFRDGKMYRLNREQNGFEEIPPPEAKETPQ